MAKKPKIDVSVHVPLRDEPTIDEKRFIRQDLTRMREKAKRYQSVLDTWVPEDVAAKAKKSVEERLDDCKMRIRELNTRLKRG
jgi:hypothetical protein